MRLQIFTIIVLLASYSAFAQDSSGPREQLKQYVAEWQKSPDDQALLEKLIKLAAALDPKPAIPEESRRHFVKAVTLQKEASKPSDYELASREYDAALILAPWWPEARFNLSVVEESQSEYARAIANLKLYILTNPTEADARSAQDRIYALEARQEKAEKDKAEQERQNSPEAIAAREREKKEQEQRQFEERINGYRWRGSDPQQGAQPQPGSQPPSGYVPLTWECRFEHGEISVYYIFYGGREFSLLRSALLRGREFDCSASSNRGGCYGIIAGDGETITFHVNESDFMLRRL